MDELIWCPDPIEIISMLGMQLVQLKTSDVAGSTYALPSPHNLRRRTTAITVSANSCTESCKILLATSSPSSAEETTTGTSAAIRAQDGSAYVHLCKIHQ